MNMLAGRVADPTWRVRFTAEADRSRHIHRVAAPRKAQAHFTVFLNVKFSV